MLFVELQYTLATEEAERIGVDHVARMSTSETGSSSTGQSFHVKMIMPSLKLGYFLRTIKKRTIYCRVPPPIGLQVMAA